MTVNTDQLQLAAQLLLRAIGEDPDREGLTGTPARFARWWAEFIDYDPGRIETMFAAEQYDEIVVVHGLQVWSLCEHHLLPFTANVTIGYLPADGVLGLSKLARLAHQAAHRLQLQERMTLQIADAVQKSAATEHVAVVARGDHLCMSMRGIRTPGSLRTSVLRGVFRDEPETRNEFLQLADGG
jgi:GTP cyclohydrolase I